jgi:hypothetical protein
MIRVYKTAFITSKRNLDRLFECNRISAQVWNDCLKLAHLKHVLFAPEERTSLHK